MYQRSDLGRHVARLFKIVLYVRSRRPGESVGRRELAAFCRCSERTVQRDVLLLQADLPLEYDRGTKSYTLPEKGWAYPLVPMGAEDAMALALARDLLTAPGLPYREQVAAALDKATAGLSPPLRALLAEAAQVLLPGVSPRDYSQAPLGPLLEAAAGKRVVEIDYESRSGGGGRAWRAVDPYAVEPREGLFWELHGWCHTNRAVRTFALDRRFHGVRLREDTFAVREVEWAAFARQQGIFAGLRGGEAVEVAVRFAPAVALYARERQWPPGLTAREEADGSVLLAGRLQGVEGILPEILRWRRHAEVLGGPELRAGMIEEIEAMAALYSEDEEKTDGADSE